MNAVKAPGAPSMAKAYLTQDDVIGPSWDDYGIGGATTITGFVKVAPSYGAGKTHLAAHRAYWSTVLPSYWNAYTMFPTPRHATPWTEHRIWKADQHWYEFPYAPILRTELGNYVINADYFGNVLWLEPTILRLGNVLTLDPAEDDRAGAELVYAIEALQFFAEALPPSAAPPSVSPLNDGGVQLEWHRGGLDVEVIFSPDMDERGIYVRDKKTGEERELPLDPDAFRNLIGSSLNAA